MASIPGHCLVAVALAAPFPSEALDRRAVVAGVICSAVPDLDVIGFPLGIEYGAAWGHRGLTHSLLAALVLALAGTALLRISALPGRPRPTIALVFTYLLVATVSHGLLDAMTDGGLGVAFLAPWSPARYFLPWRPIAVSPIGAAFLSARGLRVLASEAVWLGIPSLSLIGAVSWWRSRGTAPVDS